MTEPLKENAGRAGAILDAAERQFTRYGYRRATMDDVAGDVGVAKGTLYLYFETKAALFRAMLARNFASDQALCDRVEHKGGDLAEVLYGQLEAWFGTTFDRYGGSEHFAEIASTRNSIGADVAEAADRAFEARIIRLIQTADNDGKVDMQVRGVDAVRFASALLAGARGAKYAYGKPVAPKLYRSRLRDLSILFAAAVKI